MKNERLFAFLGRLFLLQQAEKPSSANGLVPAANSGQNQTAEAWTLQDDSSESLERARTAAEEGDPVAQNCLGLRFASGSGLSRRDQEARKWLLRAAHQGYVEAQFNLGNLCYSASLGQSPAEGSAGRTEAYVWFLVAATHGHAQAETSCETLNLQLSDAELAEGNRRARAFQSRKEGAALFESPRT